MTLPANGSQVPPGSWIAANKVQFHFHVTASIGTLTPQIELASPENGFTGQPSASGPRVSTGGQATVTSGGLADGTRYVWQARVVDNRGTPSDWVAFNTGAGPANDFGVDLTPPQRPVIASPSNPDQTTWYNTRAVRFTWSARDTGSGIKGYTFVLEQHAHVILPGSLTSQTSLNLNNLSDGTWFLALRAEDKVGNWSPTATYRVQLDRQPPQVTWLSPRRFSFNPYRGSTTVRFSVTKTASVRLRLYRVGSTRMVSTFSFQRLAAGAATSLSWSGRDGHGHIVPRGFYFFSVRAIDRASNIGRYTVGAIDVSPDRGVRAATGQLLYPTGGKLIIVSLAREELYAYDGTRLVLETPVTTGNPNLPTPAGSYTIMAKYHPFEFISPWPEGSQYYYPPSLSQYAMLFRDGGYFLHDAPWRSAFGAGTDGAGQPGTNYGGTHGCINIPPSPTFFLWNWAPVGTNVQVM